MVVNRLVGYARVSTKDQDLSLQIDALKQAGCSHGDIFSDITSGSKSARPALDKCLEGLKEGDTLIVWRLDRLGRSMAHLIKLVQELKDIGIGFKSICDGSIDTTTASGELVFNIFSSLAQFERRLIQERTQAGLSAARARGRLGGRKKIQPDDPKVISVKRLHKNHNLSIQDICKSLNISVPTFYRYLAM
jgi:DNA invertase Pin-like site-specific DNA recombinase